MAGLIILAALCAYAVFSMIVVVTVALIAGKKGRSALKWGIGAAVVMYHLVFWDLIPTWAVYKYYCVTKAGFWVYKTPEQWKEENPGVAETLTWTNRSSIHYSSPVHTRGYLLNERIAWVIIKDNAPFVPVGIDENLIVDVKNNETLVRQICIGTASGGIPEIRFWTQHKYYCPNSKEFGSLQDSYKTLGVEIK